MVKLIAKQASFSCTHSVLHVRVYSTVKTNCNYTISVFPWCFMVILIAKASKL